MGNYRLSSLAHAIYKNYLEMWSLSIYLMIYFSMDPCISVLYFAVRSSTTLPCCWNCYSFSHFGSFGSCVLLAYSHNCVFCFCFNASLFSTSTRYSKITLYICYTSPWVNHFLHGVSLLENGVRIQTLGSRFACCYYVVMVSKPSWPTEQWNICARANLCIYTHI